MTILILEDEYPAAERLQRLVALAAPTARVLAVLDTVAGALAWLAAYPAPDLILSDIQLADGLSFEVFARAVVQSPVIFTTAYDQYALQAFRANSIDYLLKPVKLPELQAALAKWQAWPARPSVLLPMATVVLPAEKNTTPATGVVLPAEKNITPAAGMVLPAEKNTMATAGYSTPALALERLLDALPRPQRPYKSRFLVRHGEALLPLAASEAAWFLSRHETTTLATHDGRRFVVDYTLEQLEALLDPALFFRLSRQVLAQVGAVQRLVPHLGGKLLAVLAPPAPADVLISKEKAAAVKSWLEG